MSRKQVDLTGQIFNRLTALAIEIRKYGGRKRTGWICQCECGKVKWVSTSNLAQGHAQSCGCIHQKPGAAFRTAIRNYKNGAKRRGYNFLLTDEQCRTLFSSDCFYCGSKPANISTAAWRYKPEIFLYQGIDRRINTQHYTEVNCIPCCYACNKAKGERDELPFIEHCKTIAARF